MNSVQLAQKTWNSFFNRRYSPTLEEAKELICKIGRDEDYDFVRKNAFRRIKGYVLILRAMVDYEPKTEEELVIKNDHMKQILERPFDEEFVFNIDSYIYCPYD